MLKKILSDLIGYLGMKRGFDEVLKVVEDELFEKGQTLLEIDY